MADIAVLGFGVVGSGTVEVFDKNSDIITQRAGQSIRIKYILDIRDFSGSPYETLFIKDFETIENDPDVTVVVEVIGGVGAAYDFTKRSLAAGKSVVTSNKELVATRGHELTNLAVENGVNYLFEASVGGGIPVIRPLAQCLSANKMTEIYGILNGTTNFILTEMIKNGAEFSDALLDAQKKGYAEADPSADIKGHDVCRKICILSVVSFGRQLHPDQVPVAGIEGVTKEDVLFAGRLGYKIKLLGRARLTGDRIAAYVAPHLVGFDHMLAGVEGVMNGIVARGNMVGDVMFYGAGAGKMPTASAVAADVIDAVKHHRTRKLIKWADGGADTVSNPALLESAWYIRTDAAREKIGREFGEVIFAPEAEGPIRAFKTPVMDEEKVRSLLGRGINALSLFRVLGDH